MTDVRLGSPILPLAGVVALSGEHVGLEGLAPKSRATLRRRGAGLDWK